jgi:hypothetical protein
MQLYLIQFTEKEAAAKDETGPDKDDSDAFAAKSSLKLSKYPRPDLNLLIPFKSENTNPYASLPDVLQQFIMALPPANMYHGPVPDVDDLMQLLKEVPLPAAPAGGSSEPQEIAQPTTSTQKKRKADDDDEEDGTIPYLSYSNSFRYVYQPSKSTSGKRCV